MSGEEMLKGVPSTLRGEENVKRSEKCEERKILQLGEKNFRRGKSCERKLENVRSGIRKMLGLRRIKAKEG